MAKNKTLGFVTLGVASALLLAACGGSSAKKESGSAKSEDSKKFSIVMVTDSGGVDDKSFNQSAWTSMEAWGKETGRSKGKDGYNNIISKSESEYATNFNTAIKAKYDLIYAVGFKLEKAVNEVAKANKDNHFVAVDAVIDSENGASILFAENEAAFLAGVAAAKTTKTNHIGYIGGVENEVLIRFESGFIAGAKSVNKDIKIDSQFVGSFVDAATATTMANAMFSDNVDVIYAAAGASGLGVFSAAKVLMEDDNSKGLWVIGVDLDQEADGKYKTKDGKETTLTLTSTLKKVGEAVVKFAKDTEANGFKAGKTVYTLKDGGVDLTDGKLEAAAKEAVAAAKKDIIEGKLKAPGTRDEVKAFEATLK